MFGLSWPLLAGLVLGWLLAGLFGWGCIHEYGVAHATAAQDSAIYAKAQADVTAKALAQQQAIDAKQLAQADRMRKDAEKAVSIAQATIKAANDNAAKARAAIRVIIRKEPPSACAKAPIPAGILGQLHAH